VGGAHVRGIFWRVRRFFGSKSTISRLGERFRDGQYSQVSLLFAVLLLRCPLSQPFVKVGEAHAPVHYRVGATVHRKYSKIFDGPFQTLLPI